jgi:hypothetical protein
MNHLLRCVEEFGLRRTKSGPEDGGRVVGGGTWDLSVALCWAEQKSVPST